MSAQKDDQLLYFAYGSNLHPLRLKARIPSSQLVGIAELKGYELAFHKRGGDLTAKCNALFSGGVQAMLPGAVYTLLASHKAELDTIEGPGYRIEEVVITLDGVSRRAFMYVAQHDYIDDSLVPFSWYRDFVYLGALYHRFPEAYTQAILTISTTDDDDQQRCARNEQLLALLR